MAGRAPFRRGKTSNLCQLERLGAIARRSTPTAQVDAIQHLIFPIHGALTKP